MREKVFEKRERQNFRCENCPGWSDDDEEVDDSDYDDDGDDYDDEEEVGDSDYDDDGGLDECYLENVQS